MSTNALTSEFKAENTDGFKAPPTSFTSEDKVSAFYTFPVYNKTKQFYFKDCKTVSFFAGPAKPGKDHSLDYIFSKAIDKNIAVTGYMEVPAGIEVVVETGYVKCAEEPAVQRLLSEAAARA